MQWTPNGTGGHFNLTVQTLIRAGEDEKPSKNRKPPVLIHKRLLPWLRRWHESDGAHGISAVCHYDGRQIEKLRGSWETIRKSAGLDHAITPHVLQHTCVTWLLQEGVPTWEVTGYVGMSEETVRNVYGHHSPDHQSKAINSR